MDAKQRKALKREKIRKEHLEAARKQRLAHAVNLYSESGPLTYRAVAPERNDRDGWSVYLDLNKEKVIKRTFALNKGNSMLRRFFLGQGREKENVELSLLFTRAAQTFHCNPPYLVPFYMICGNFRNGYQAMLNWFKLEKKTTPYGTAWSFSHKPEKEIGELSAAFSTHAVDRIMERLEIPKKVPEYASWMTLMFKFKPSSYPKMFDVMSSNGKKLIGHCPYDVYEGQAIANTFLFPGMTGTPEEAFGAKLKNGKDEPITLKWFTDERIQQFSERGLEILHYDLLPWKAPGYDFLRFFAMLCEAIMDDVKKHPFKEDDPTAPTA